MITDRWFTHSYRSYSRWMSDDSDIRRCTSDNRFGLLSNRKRAAVRRPATGRGGLPLHPQAHEYLCITPTMHWWMSTISEVCPIGDELPCGGRRPVGAAYLSTPKHTNVFVSHPQCIGVCQQYRRSAVQWETSCCAAACGRPRRPTSLPHTHEYYCIILHTYIHTYITWTQCIVCQHVVQHMESDLMTSSVYSQWSDNSFQTDQIKM